jgi:hypothetical protein
MKKIKVLWVVLATLFLMFGKSYSQTTNQWGDAVFGLRLSIAMTNNACTIGSKIFITCITTNYFTNTVYFVQTESRGIYEVVLIDDSGKSIELNNPKNVGDGSEKMKGVKPGESFQCPAPLLLDEKIKSGHYRVIAKQKVYLVKNIDRKNMIQGELVSNPLELTVK